MYQIMKTGKIIIPHESKNENQKDVWIKLDLGEQSLKSTPNERTVSARDKSIKEGALITSMGDLLSLSANSETTKEELDLIAELNKEFKETESMRNIREESEKKKVKNIMDQLSNFVKKTKNNRKNASAPAAPASRPAPPRAPINAWGSTVNKS